jgi:hypoxia up-regulated 1
MSAVLGIDLGTQFFKVAYVKTGSFDLVLNEASKRKTASAVAFNEGERLVGDTANALKLKRPTKVVTKYNRLLGRLHGDPVLDKYGFGEYDLPFKLSKDPTRGTVVVDLEDGEQFQPEEILGWVLSYIRDIAQQHLEQKVMECVITVPPFMTEHERRLLHDAAALVGLKLLMLLNDNTAAALRYGIETPMAPGKTMNVLFVDLGASHLTNTIVTYFTNNISSYEQVPSMEVKAITYDAAIGGSSFDRRLTLHLAKAFNEKHKKKIEDFPKAMIKLAKEAEKVKSVLSANMQTMVMVESLLDDVDFKFKITRSEFEELCQDLFEALEQTIANVIEQSGFAPAEIEQVVPFGAGTRMPRLKSSVLKATARDQWTPRINTDEAAALGAAFVAANFSKSFKLRKYHIYDLFPFSIGVTVSGKQATLFSPRSRLDAKKTLTQPVNEQMKQDDSLSLSLAYDNKDVLPADPEDASYITALSEYTVTGFNAALAKHNVTGEPKVALAIGLGADGITELIHADIKVHSMDMVKKQRFVKKNVTVEEWVPHNDTNSTEDNATVSEAAPEAAPEASADELQAANDTDGNESANSSNKSNAPPPSKPKGSIQNVTREKTVEVWEEALQKVLHLEPLNISRAHKGVVPLSSQDFEVAQKRHLNLSAQEKERTDKVNAKNELEAWIFGARQKLNEDEMETVTTEEERTQISELLEQGEDWLWDEGEDVATAVYKSKKANMSEDVRDAFFRYEQLEARASAVKLFNAVVADTRQRVLNWTAREEKRIAANESTWIHKNETDRLTKMVDEAEAWLTEKQAELEKLGLLEKPPFSARELEQQIRPVQSEVEYLRYRPKPKSKSKPKRTANATNATNTTGSNDTDSNAASMNKTSNQPEADQSDKSSETTTQKEEL